MFDETAFSEFGDFLVNLVSQKEILLVEENHVERNDFLLTNFESEVLVSFLVFVENIREWREESSSDSLFEWMVENIFRFVLNNFTASLEEKII